MAIMEISVVPLGTDIASVSTYVKNALKVLKEEPDIEYQVTAMGTIIETDSADKLLDIAKKMHNIVLSDTVRVVTTIKIDDRKDKKLTMEGKVKSVCASCKEPKPDVDRWFLEGIQNLLKKIGVRKGQKVIDFGCRSGNYTITVAEIVGRKGRVYGVDKEKNALNQLQQKAQARNLKNIVVLQSWDWERQLGKNSLDVALLFDVLHPGYFPDKSSRKKLLRKLYSVLKPRGIVWVTPMHVEERSLSLKNFIAEIEACKFCLERKFIEMLVHDDKMQKCEILKFRKLLKN